MGIEAKSTPVSWIRPVRTGGLMRRVVVAFCLLLTVAAASAEALTIRDIIELSRAKLGDDVLLALIEVDGGVFPIDNDTLTKLKSAGVSERVIMAIVRSGRTRPVNEDPQIPVAQELPPPPMPPPQVIVVTPPTEVIREVAVPYAVPIYVTVPVRSRAGRHVIYDRSTLVDGYANVYAAPVLPNQPVTRYLTDIPQKRSEPVYWGHGGNLRPDAWEVPGSKRDRR
jgi:hypothetical protein